MCTVNTSARPSPVRCPFAAPPLVYRPRPSIHHDVRRVGYPEYEPIQRHNPPRDNCCRNNYTLNNDRFYFPSVLCISSCPYAPDSSRQQCSNTVESFQYGCRKAIVIRFDTSSLSYPPHCETVFSVEILYFFSRIN